MAKPLTPAPQLQLFDLAGRSVRVLGLGESGLAMARWALYKGARVSVVDTRAEPPGLATLRAEAAEAQFVCAPLDADLLDDVDLLAWSPGLSIELGASGELYRMARERGVAVAGEIELFVQALASLREQDYTPKLAVLTGTNGKTTTTALLAHLAEHAGIRARAAGNISPAALDVLREAIIGDTLPDLWILELSSFQLALTDSLHADAAAILNVSQDHLDWHASMASYIAAKQRIYAGARVSVFNRDDEATRPVRAKPAVKSSGRSRSAANLAAVAAAAAARVAVATGSLQADAPVAPIAQIAQIVKSASDVETGTEAFPVEVSQADVGAPIALVPVAVAPVVGTVSFGLGLPESIGDVGVQSAGGIEWLAEAVAAEETVGRRSKLPPPMMIKRMMPAEALQVSGLHNRANVLAALVIARAVGVPMNRMLHGLRDYFGEPHRCQLVATIDDVQFYDDSKGTNVGATVAALAGLAKPIVLIAGGEGKGQDFAPLADAVAKYARAVVLIGRDAPLIAQALSHTGIALETAASLQAAVDRAAEQAHAGDAVLLSPACASFDMFRDYRHRADVFVDAVRERAAQAGVLC